MTRIHRREIAIRSFEIFFHFYLNYMLKKQSSYRERHAHVTVLLKWFFKARNSFKFQIQLPETKIMMTSSNGNIFRITGHLCGEFTGHRSIPLTKANDTELWCFLWSAPGQAVEYTSDLNRHCTHYNVTVFTVSLQWNNCLCALRTYSHFL